MAVSTRKITPLMDPRPFAAGDALNPDTATHQLDPGTVAAVLADVPRAIAVLAALLRQRREARGIDSGSDAIEGICEWQCGPSALPRAVDEVETMLNEWSVDAPGATIAGHDRHGGEFSLSGLTLGAGQFVVGGVSFSHRAEIAPACDEITLWIDDQQNLPTGGLVVMRDGGFAPSREGFALAMASAEAGVVRAHGRWSVTTPTIDVPRG